MNQEQQIYQISIFNYRAIINYPLFEVVIYLIKHKLVYISLRERREAFSQKLYQKIQKNSKLIIATMMMMMLRR